MAHAERTDRVVTKRPLQEQTTQISTSASTTSVNFDTIDADGQGPVPEMSAGNKRRRTALACGACRTRKTRCDGARPVCSACENQGYQCVYSQPVYSDNITVGSEHLFTLESRLSVLEGKFKAVEQRTIRREPVELQLPVERIDEDWQDGHSTRVSVEDEVAPALSGLDGPTDSMGAMVFTDEEDFGFFGPSSNIAFTRHISHAVARITQSRQTWATPGTEESLKFAGRMTRDSGPASPVRRSQGRERPKASPVNICFIPTEPETRRLLKSYFAYIGTLYPYVHEATFMEIYEEMKRNNFRRIRRTWLGLFNMVLALATSVPYRSEFTVEKRTERANEFYQRALSLCKEQMMRGTSLEVVQFLLLVGQYLQGTRQSLQTWTVHGLAVKAALQLGLHSSEALKRFPPLDREIRKRTWYGCIVLDRTLCMTFGRPSIIHEDFVRLELPSRYPEGLTVGNPTNPNDVISMEFFNATIKLYKIMSKAIELLYSGNVGVDRQIDVFDNIAGLFSLEQQLAGWKVSLPVSLMLRESRPLSWLGEENPLTCQRSRVVLTLRYHNVRILVHRLILVRFLDLAGQDDHDEQQFALVQQTGFHSVQICMHAASEIIAIVNQVVHSTGVQRTFLGAWWFTLYYTFNAALVIFSGLLLQKTRDTNASFSVTLEVSRSTLDDAAAALRLLDVGNRMSEKCGKYVEQLGRLVDLIGNSTLCYGQGNPAMPNDLNGTMTSNVLGDQTNSTSTMFPTQNDFYASPLGMGFGDFIVGDDIGFLNTFFNT